MAAASRIVAALTAVALATAVATAQPKPADPPRASAVKLPDGAIVFVTKSPDDLDPAVEKIVVSPQEWKALQEQVEQAKKLATAKPVAPSGCAVRVRIDARGERPVAAITVTFAVRTAQPRTVVALGLQRAQVTAAKGDGGRLPILNPPGDDGLTVLFETGGEHTLALELEAAVTPRGKGEIGFDLGLPRAAITTVALDQPPATATKSVTVGTRTDGKATDPKRSAVAVDVLKNRPLPLGATDLLELSWEPPSAATAVVIPTADSDVVVRIDDGQIETTAKLRLRGPLKEWQLALPVGADVIAERSAAPDAPAGTAAPTVVRPSDPNKPLWVVKGPADPISDWLVTVTTRQVRPKPTEPKFRGPYPLGPFTALGGVKQSGKLSVFAPPTARLTFKGTPEFRRQDVPAEDGPAALFQFGAVPVATTNAKAPPWLELDARSLPPVARVRPAHKLTLHPDGWHWEATVKVVPPPRGEVEQLLIELPGGWETLTAKPEELVDEVQVVSDAGPVKTRLIRLTAPQKGPFELVLLSRFPVAVAAGTVPLHLPRFPQAEEREATVTATVPAEFEVRGVAGNEPLKAVAADRPPVTTVGGSLDRPGERVDLTWQPHRPELAVDGRAEVTVFDQQTVVAQVLKFKTNGDGKPIRLSGPAGAVGVKAVPPLEPVAPGEWLLRPPADAEFTSTASFALRHPPRRGGSGELPVGLLSAVQATRTETTARVWSAASGRRVEAFAGTGWRELSPEPAADRDTLPTFTLTASGTPALTVEWADASEAAGPSVIVDRGLILVTLADDGTAAVRGRFVLRRWPAGGVEVELPLDTPADLFADGKKVDVQSGVGVPDPDERTVKVPLPEPKPGRAVTVLDVRYQLNAARTSAGGRAVLPPVIRSASYRTSVRWHVTAPPGAVALVPFADWQNDTRWGWRGLGVAPTAANTPAELEQWLTAGTDTDPSDGGSWVVPAGGDTVAARQAIPNRVSVILLPRIGWIGGVSAVAFLTGLGVSRLRSRWAGPAVAVIGVGLAVLAAVSPQPAGQLLAAAQPGLAALALLLAGKSSWTWYARRRIDRLPAFRRSRGGTGSAAPAAPSPAASGPGRSNRGPSAEVQLEPDAPPSGTR